MGLFTGEDGGTTSPTDTEKRQGQMVQHMKGTSNTGRKVGKESADSQTGLCTMGIIIITKWRVRELTPGEMGESIQESGLME